MIWVGTRVLFCNEEVLFLVGSTIGEDFAPTKCVQHGVVADGVGLPGGDKGGDFLRRQAFEAEIGV